MASVVLALTAAAWAATPCPPGVSHTAAELSEALDGAEEAYSRGAADDFLAASAPLEELVACLSAPLPRELAPTLHRVRGMRAFVDGEERKATEAFAAARHLAPDYALPRSLVPRGTEMHALYEGVLEAPTTDPVVPPDTGALWFDGRRSSDRPSTRATVAQVTAKSGTVVVSSYLFPDDPLPPLEPERGRGGSSRVLPLVVASLGAAALSAGAFAAGAASADPEGGNASGALLLTGAGLAGVAAGTGVGAGIHAAF